MRKRHYDLPPLAQLEAFEAAARHLSFTKAAEELALTQSAVSRQIAAIEERLGVPLFRRLHRALALTAEGEVLGRAVGDVLRHLHHVTGQIRGQARTRTVVVTTTAGLASLWLIPRLARFAEREPDVDVRISTSQAVIPLDREGFDLAIRYTGADSVGPDAQLLFAERAFPVCTPALRDDPARPLREPADLRRHVLLHVETGAAPWTLEWPLWLGAVGLPDLQPVRSMRFSQYDQLIAAALGGQGVALGRSPILDGLLAEGRLVAPFTEVLDTARAYYVVQSTGAGLKPEVQAFVRWLLDEARASTP